MTTERPKNVKLKHLVYLDNLRENGATNMWGAVPYIMREFNIPAKAAREILGYWMDSFGEHHPKRGEGDE